MRAVCLLIAFLLPVSCAAQSAPNNNQVAFKALGGFIALSVADNQSQHAMVLGKARIESHGATSPNY